MKSLALLLSLLGTFVLSATNLFLGPQSVAGQSATKYWLAAMFFVAAHAYPLRFGLRLMGLQSGGFKDYTNAEIAGIVEKYRRVNFQRLFIVDIPGWFCVFTAVFLSLGRA